MLSESGLIPMFHMHIKYAVGYELPCTRYNPRLIVELETETDGAFKPSHVYRVNEKTLFMTLEVKIVESFERFDVFADVLRNGVKVLFLLDVKLINNRFSCIEFLS